MPVYIHVLNVVYLFQGRQGVGCLARFMFCVLNVVYDLFQGRQGVGCLACRSKT